VRTVTSCWEGCNKKDDTWEPITHLQRCATMVKSFKESHAKDLEKLAADLQREEEKTATDDLVNTPKHTVLSMVGLTSPVWTLGMFQIVTGKFCSASDAPNRRIRATLVFDMLCKQCNKCGLSSDIRTRPIWSSTESEVDLITKNSQVDWLQCSKWRGGCSWELQQMATWRCLAYATLLLMTARY
jgi:hypothetical protein